MAPSALRIALYVPNLIGYVRMALLFACLPYAFTDPFKFIVLYGLSYALDALDGVAARHLGQCSRFGALLDMVTDRAATAALLAVNAYTYAKVDGADSKMPAIFLGLMVLDIVSHWAQMYSSMMVNADSHKNLKDEHWLLRFYYTFPYALFTVCAFNEMCLVAFFAVKNGSALVWFNEPTVASFLFNEAVPISQALLMVGFPVFVLKQIFSLLQLFTAVRRILAHDARLAAYQKALSAASE